MIKTLGDIQRDVRVAMDMNQADTGLLGVEDAETLELDEMIRAKVLDAVRLVHMSAPVEMLESGHRMVPIYDDRALIPMGGAVVKASDRFPGAGYVILPSDFMRLVYFKFSSWAYGVTTPVEEGSAQHRMMSSPVAAVRGTWDRPKVALVRTGIGLVLEFTGCREGVSNELIGSYMPEPTLDEDEGVDVSERCYPAIVEQTAALVLATIGDARAATHAEIAKSLMRGKQVEIPQASVQGE